MIASIALLLLSINVLITVIRMNKLEKEIRGLKRRYNNLSDFVIKLYYNDNKNKGE